MGKGYSGWLKDSNDMLFDLIFELLAHWIDIILIMYATKYDIYK